MRTGPSIKLLTICENAHEAQSMLQVAAKLSELSSGQVTCQFAVLDDFLFQNAGTVLKQAGIAYITLAPTKPLSRPLYEYGLVYGILILIANQTHLASFADGYDGVLCGVDAFVVRIILSEAQKQKKPTFQFYGTLHFDIPGLGVRRSPLHQLARNWFKQVLIWTLKADFLRASGNECQSGCDRVFVMGERIKRSLELQGVKGVVASGNPRFSQLFEDIPVQQSPEWQGKFVVLYLPSSFVWHSDWHRHKQQQEQLHQIVDWMEGVPNRPYQLVIKNHPREKDEYYNWLNGRRGVSFLSGPVDLYSVIRQSDVVLSMISLSIFEAMALKRPVIVTNFPVDATRPNQLLALDQLAIVSSMEELGHKLESMRTDRTVYNGMVAKEEPLVNDFIAPHTPQAAEIIASEILRFIDETG